MFFTLKYNEYNTGTKAKVNIVETIKPKIIEIAIGSHIAPPLYHKGTSPKTVVSVVKTIGLNLLRLASIIDS